MQIGSKQYSMICAEYLLIKLVLIFCINHNSNNNVSFFFHQVNASNEKQTLTKQQKQSEKKYQQDLQTKIKALEQEWTEKLK